MSLVTVLAMAVLVASILLLTGPLPAHAGVSKASINPRDRRAPLRRGRVADVARPRHGTTAYRAWVILQVFGPHDGPLAVRVAKCEGGPGLDTNARDYADASHWGLFQVSPALRRDYPGYGPGAWAQARHARRVFNASGHTFYPHWHWSIRCWGR